MVRISHTETGYEFVDEGEDGTVDVIIAAMERVLANQPPPSAREQTSKLITLPF
jgi:hypothetical protein